ncbi:hypothetical protein [Ancylobacter lacus]|uniref:hypothetical protein n=1 Tax=Ancylobacter lacus TaxID=2579970 RepID=UPI001BCF8E55|nr:hypothetical protein [Ancylobacter lacus]MBS7541486.1 hypothetical protein [Ancylobacter lacus]
MVAFVRYGDVTVDIEPHVLTAVRLFAPDLLGSVGDMANVLAAAHTHGRPDWKAIGLAKESSQNLDVVTARSYALAYAEYLRRQLSDPAVLAYRPLGRFRAGEEACARAEALHNRLLPTSELPYPPFTDCDFVSCQCSFVALSKRAIALGK